MNYCVPGDIISAVSSDVLAEMLGVAPGDLPTTTAIANAIADACGRIDSYLASRYTLPLAVAAESLRVVAVDIAIYYLFRLRRPGDLDDYLKRYQVQLDWLERVRLGDLDVPEMAAVADANVDAVRVIAPASTVGWGSY